MPVSTSPMPPAAMPGIAGGVDPGTAVAVGNEGSGALENQDGTVLGGQLSGCGHPMRPVRRVRWCLGQARHLTGMGRQQPAGAVRSNRAAASTEMVIQAVGIDQPGADQSL